LPHTLPTLSLLETRVLGVLFEKEHTVPDSYPLTLNALVAGCNQKSGREPVIEASDTEVQLALDTLKQHSAVIESSGNRVSRYAQNIARVLQVPSQSCALLATMMLRGPQTAGELRTHSERLHRFADISSVEAFLEELCEREAGALVVKLPRLPGAREHRWAHTLSGMPELDAPAAAMASTMDASLAARSDISLGEVAALKANVARLEGELGEMRALLHRVCAELGIAP
jgi:uncharacterized protein YceH (UPF0502 family)